MEETNRNGWTKWLVATLWGVLMTVILFMGNIVKANDEKNSTDHTVIRKEIVGIDNKINDKIEKIVAEINSKQTSILIQQAQMAIVLERIEKRFKN